MTAKPQTYAVMGDPVAHSLSPELFEWLFKQLGVDARYVRLHVRPEELKAAVDRVRAGELQGASVTIPHKEAVLNLVDELDASAQEMKACNCLVRVTGGLRGYNTDAAGFRDALAHHGKALAGRCVLILGSGGAGRAAAFAAVASGARKVFLANRSGDRAQRLGQDLISATRAAPSAAAAAPSSPDSTSSGGRASSAVHPKQAAPASSPDPSGGRSQTSVTVVPLAADSLSPALEKAEIVVNATSVGLMNPIADPLPRACQLSARHTVLDMVYRPLQTSLMTRTTSAGGTAIDGLWMLLYQAFEQLKLWTGLALSPSLARRAHDFLRGEAQ